MKRVLLVLLFALAACSADSVTREEWQAMNATEKSLYVKSLLGAEQAKASKGGNNRTFKQSADEYVRRIDDAYARGDRREAAAIFDEMGQR